MKSKTIWYTLLLVMIFGSMVMEFLNEVVGMILLGLSAYAAGAYHIKWRTENYLNENKELL